MFEEKRKERTRERERERNYREERGGEGACTCICDGEKEWGKRVRERKVRNEEEHDGERKGEKQGTRMGLWLPWWPPSPKAMLLLIPSRKQCTGVDVSLCSLSIRLDSEVLTFPEIPILMSTCPRKVGSREEPFD